ncbi:MAG: SAM-dependent methyltransferase [Oscillospiraceae bacterium]|nr:SAM-dependent methyltransferase [Oscillospiraceae bacterium]
MTDIKLKLNDIFNENLIFAILSDTRKNIDPTFSKVQIKPFIKKNELLYQIAYLFDKKVTHSNLSRSDVVDTVSDLLQNHFLQAVFYTSSSDFHVSMYGGFKLRSFPPTKLPESAPEHNVQKKYILPEGTPHDFLVKLGIMTKDGRVVKDKYNKFRQINRYLEFVDDCLKYLPSNRTVNIVDFGCGKAYLTFALYYYLVIQKHLSCSVIGLDLKDDVIRFCSDVALDLGYSSLRFQKGDIRSFDGSADMVISLHACNTATDFSLAKAVSWNSKVILAVPCCHHELFDKISNPDMYPLLEYGAVKEKLSSMLTDVMRAQLLRSVGYDTSIIEFIDTEHTPKNLLIRAVRNSSAKFDREKYNEYKKFSELWNASPILEELIRKLDLIP